MKIDGETGKMEHTQVRPKAGNYMDLRAGDGFAGGTERLSGPGRGRRAGGCNDLRTLTLNRRPIPHSKGDHDHLNRDRSDALRLRRFKESFTGIAHRL
jgi:hypothetical protein